MEKEFKVNKEFIIEAHKSACSDWKKKIENKFPEAFKVIDGTWMINTTHGNCLVLIPEGYMSDEVSPNSHNGRVTVAIHDHRTVGNGTSFVYTYNYWNSDKTAYRKATSREIIEGMHKAILNQGELNR